jgi:hypothetical protein
MLHYISFFHNISCHKKTEISFPKRGKVFMVFNVTLNNISVILWLSVLLLQETGIPWENHRPVTSHWQTLRPWWPPLSQISCIFWIHSSIFRNVSCFKFLSHRQREMMYYRYLCLFILLILKYLQYFFFRHQNVPVKLFKNCRMEIVECIYHTGPVTALHVLDKNVIAGIEATI